MSYLTIDPNQTPKKLENAEVVSSFRANHGHHVELVRVDGGLYVRKRKDLPKRGLARWRIKRRGHGNMRHEANVYRALEQVTFEHFRAPRLVASDRRFFLLLEYLPHETGQATSVGVLAAAGRAIAEFQRLPLVFPKPPVRHTLRRYHVMHHMIQSTRYLKSVLPSGVAWQCLALAVRLHRQQPALPRFLVTHNDLHPRNLGRDEERNLVMLDFPSVAYTRRWIFGDVASYGFSAELEGWMPPALVAAYVAEIEAHPAFEGVQSAVQLRIVLLQKLLQRMAISSKKNRPFPREIEFITDTLLDDEAYEAWYEALMREGRTALSAAVDLAG